MKFIKRESAPEKTDAHFYSENIFYKSGYGMPNCTTYAWGRFYELIEQLGISGTPKLQTSNAENWYVDECTYQKGQTPKLGAVIVWKKGQRHNSKDGAGHVAIIEEIKPDGSIVVSQSAWKGREFYLTEHNSKYEKAGYQFEGFIYLPKNFDFEEEVKPVEQAVSNNNDFKIGDKVLVLSGYASETSYGTGNHTASYTGNINDPGDIKYITIINEGTLRPYHLSNDKENTKPRGWVSAKQIKKI